MSGNRFHKTLAPVQLLRDREAEAARDAFGSAIQARTKQEEAVAEAESALEARLHATAMTAAVWRLRADAEHRTAAHAALAEARQQLRHRLDAEAASRRDLAGATMRQEAILDLRASAQKAARAERARRETMALDDIAASRTLRPAA
ncbi:MAG: hypothetical protein AAF845_01795 [Bacteroidota bacterium]